VSKKVKNGAVVFYIDIGQLPLEKAQEFLDKQKEVNKEFLDSLPEGVSNIWLPVRNGNTRIEYLPL
jgi:hypothetical protein